MFSCNRPAAAAALVLLLTACGGEGSGLAPGTAPTASPSPTEGVPARTSTATYQTAFSADESRTFAGFGYEIVSRPTGATDASGGRIFSRDIRFTDAPEALFEFDASRRAALFRFAGVDFTAVDDGTNFSRYSNSVQWYDPFGPDPVNIGFGGYGGNIAPYVAFAKNEYRRADGADVVQTMFGGSPTLSADLPPRGTRFQNVRVTVDAPDSDGVPAAFGQGSASLRFDFTDDTVTIRTAPVEFAAGSSVPGLDIVLSGRLVRADALLSANVSDARTGASGVVRGFCFGPYCEDILLLGSIRFPNGRQAIVTVTGFD